MPKIIKIQQRLLGLQREMSGVFFETQCIMHGVFSAIIAEHIVYNVDDDAENDLLHELSLQLMQVTANEFCKFATGLSFRQRTSEQMVAVFVDRELW